MVVVAGGIIPTQNHNFLLGRGENNGGKEIRCYDSIFGPGTCITDAAVEVLRLIRDKKGDDDLHMTSDLHLEIDLN